jgi:hypothetical protein
MMAKKPTIVKEMLVGFTGKSVAELGKLGTDACFKLLAFDNHELHRDEAKWLHWLDCYDMVLLITVRDDHLSPIVLNLGCNRRLVFKSQP